MIKVILFGLVVWAVLTWMKRPTPARKPRLDEAEARAVLGLGVAASTDEIRAAHRRLVSAVHPDRGGSAELTRRINAARDLLLQQSTR